MRTCCDDHLNPARLAQLCSERPASLVFAASQGHDRGPSSQRRIAEDLRQEACAGSRTRLLDEVERRRTLDQTSHERQQGGTHRVCQFRVTREGKISEQVFDEKRSGQSQVGGRRGRRHRWHDEARGRGVVDSGLDVIARCGHEAACRTKHGHRGDPFKVRQQRVRVRQYVIDHILRG